MYGGQYLDSETGLYYLRARYYDPRTAEFLTVDPAAAATLSAYGYSQGNPVNASDPSGQACVNRQGDAGWVELCAWGTGRGWYHYQIYLTSFEAPISYAVMWLQPFHVFWTWWGPLLVPLPVAPKVVVACCSWRSTTVGGWMWAPGANFIAMAGVFWDRWWRPGGSILPQWVSV